MSLIFHCVCRALGKEDTEIYFRHTHGGVELDLFWQCGDPLNSLLPGIYGLPNGCAFEDFGFYRMLFAGAAGEIVVGITLNTKAMELPKYREVSAMSLYNLLTHP